MKQKTTNKHLDELENELLNHSVKIPIELNKTWIGEFPDEAAVYIFREKDKICYVGKTGSLRGRMKDVLNTKNHTIRRNLGHFHFADHAYFEKATSKKGFHADIEVLLGEIITKNSFYGKMLPLTFFIN